MRSNPFQLLNGRLQDSPWSGLGDVVENYQKGYEGAQNLRLNAEKLKQMQIPDMGELQKIMQEKQRVYSQYPEGSPERQLADQWVKLKTEGKPLVQNNIGQDPDTGALVRMNGPSGTSGGSSGGSIPTLTPNNETISAPTTATQTQVQNNALSNITREYVASEGVMPTEYIGAGATKRLLADRVAYMQESDPQKKAEIGDRLAKAAAAEKLVLEGVAAQLNSQGIRPTNFTIKKQLEGMQLGWPWEAQIILDYLPQEVQQKANDYHFEHLNEISKRQGEFAAKGFPQKLTSKKLEEAAKGLGYTMSEVKHAAKRRGVSEQEVIEKLNHYQGAPNAD